MLTVMEGDNNLHILPTHDISKYANDNYGGLYIKMLHNN